MPRDERRRMIGELEKLLRAKVICFVTSDRLGLQMEISRDCLKILQQHFRPKERHDSLALYIVSHGGDLDVPWALVNFLRSHCRKLRAVVPYICHSAATLIAVGCDEIIAGPRAELSPTDPTLRVRTAPEEGAPTMQFGVEDINAFVEFLRDRLGSGFKRHGHEALTKLMDTIPPHLLGSINRNYFRIRLLIEKMLRLGTRKYKARDRDEIIDRLTVSYYAHTHFISRREMRDDLKLPVVDAEKLNVDGLIWELYEDFAGQFESRSPFSIHRELQRSGQNPLTLELAGKFVESAGRADRYVESWTVSGTGVPNLNFTVPQVEGVPGPALQQVIDHFRGELQRQLQPLLVAKKVSSFGEWRTE